MTEQKKNVVALVLARLRNVAEEDGHSFNDVLRGETTTLGINLARRISVLSD